MINPALSLLARKRSQQGAPDGPLSLEDLKRLTAASEAIASGGAFPAATGERPKGPVALAYQAKPEATQYFTPKVQSIPNQNRAGPPAGERPYQPKARPRPEVKPLQQTGLAAVPDALKTHYGSAPNPELAGAAGPRAMAPLAALARQRMSAPASMPPTMPQVSGIDPPLAAGGGMGRGLAAGPDEQVIVLPRSRKRLVVPKTMSATTAVATNYHGAADMEKAAKG